MALGRRDGFIENEFNVFGDTADNFNVGSFVSRKKRRKKIKSNRGFSRKRRKRVDHVRSKRASRVRKKGRRYPHHLKKYMFKKGHKRKA